MGSAQVPNYPNLRTRVRTDAGNVQAIVELESPIEPVQGDVPFAVTEFEVFAGACWCDKCDTTCTYIITNAAQWGE